MMGSIGLIFIPNLGMSQSQTWEPNVAKLPPMRPRDILRINLKALMASHPNLGTIERVSKASGVSKGVVERMTKAEANTGIDHLDGVAQAFGVRVCDLLDTKMPGKSEEKPLARTESSEKLLSDDLLVMLTKASETEISLAEDLLRQVLCRSTPKPKRGVG